MSRRLASASDLATISAATSWALWRTRAVSAPKRRRQGGLVEHRVGGPVLGVGQLVEQLPLPIGHAPQADGQGFEVGTYLVGVEPATHRPERVPGHIVGGQVG